MLGRDTRRRRVAWGNQTDEKIGNLYENKVMRTLDQWGWCSESKYCYLIYMISEVGLFQVLKVPGCVPRNRWLKWTHWEHCWIKQIQDGPVTCTVKYLKIAMQILVQVKESWATCFQGNKAMWHKAEAPNFRIPFISPCDWCVAFSTLLPVQGCHSYCLSNISDSLPCRYTGPLDTPWSPWIPK